LLKQFLTGLPAINFVPAERRWSSFRRLEMGLRESELFVWP
jgi:hypothetical protein